MTADFGIVRMAIEMIGKTDTVKIVEMGGVKTAEITATTAAMIAEAVNVGAGIAMKIATSSRLRLTAKASEPEERKEMTTRTKTPPT